METKWVAGIVGVAVIIVVLLWQFTPLFSSFSLIGVSRVEIDPTTTGYKDSRSGEWCGSYWIISLSTDFDDQIAGFHLAANDGGDPSETYAESLGSKTTVSSYTSGGKQLVPTADVMVHIQPHSPYYEREMEIQQGKYVKEAWGRSFSLLGNPRTSEHVDELVFRHYSFADVGGGNWILHTPFLVTVYKNGELYASREIDSVGGAIVYRIPESGGGDEAVYLIDLGKLDTSGYGEPQWDDILYFNENNIFVRSPTADNLLRYDSGETPTSVMGSAVGKVSAHCFSTYWYGDYRWMSDGTPTTTGTTNLPSGFVRSGDSVVPKRPDVFSNIIPYLKQKNIQTVNMPTGFSHLEKVTGAQSKNYLRVYFNYGTKSSLVIVKISTELADTIVWQPQVANFEITSFPDFGDVANIKTSYITIKCVGGAGSAQVSFTKSPADLSLSVIPVFGTGRLENGESVKIPFDIQNLGTESSMDFSIIAKVKNVLGSVTDTATAKGRLLEKTGSSTIVNVVTQYEDTLINGLPVTIEYAGDSQTKHTGPDGVGIATFNLETSEDVSVTASYAGGDIYLAKSKTVDVSGGTEATIYLNLLKEGEIETDDFWVWVLVAAVVAVAVVVVVYSYKKELF